MTGVFSSIVFCACLAWQSPARRMSAATACIWAAQSAGALQENIRRNEERLRQLNLPALASEVSPAAAGGAPSERGIKAKRQKKVVEKLPKKRTRADGLDDEMTRFAGGVLWESKGVIEVGAQAREAVRLSSAGVQAPQEREPIGAPRRRLPSAPQHGLPIAPQCNLWIVLRLEWMSFSTTASIAGASAFRTEFQVEFNLVPSPRPHAKLMCREHGHVPLLCGLLT